MLTQFATVILYTQLVLANPSGPDSAPLLWSDDEVAQGFAWDPHAVAFGIPDHDGECLVSVTTDAPPAGEADDALWAVAVPFTARSTLVQVGTVTLERAVPIVLGSYQVVFQARPGTGGHALRLDLTLSPSDEPGYAILRQGSLGTGHVLRRQARRG